MDLRGNLRGSEAICIALRCINYYPTFVSVYSSPGDVLHNLPAPPPFALQPSPAGAEYTLTLSTCVLLYMIYVLHCNTRIIALLNLHPAMYSNAVLRIQSTFFRIRIRGFGFKHLYPT